ncbi:MAG: tetratricopeptide repeat protein [Bacteroidales bacterium]|nr:tetratricopeptide repeat protein [Bacteroidales bacterium]MCF8403429.1 tetratricopeptide repeat protein [Bacteroidales bacterium]
MDRIQNISIVILTLLSLIFKAEVSFPQNYEEKRSEIDSLLFVLPTSVDEAKVDILLQLSTIYLSISMDSSKEYARMALKNAKEINLNPKMAEAYKILGNISYYKGTYGNVVSYYDSSLSIYILGNDSTGQSKVLNNMGIIYRNLGDFQRSIDYHLKSLQLKISLKDSAGIANSYNNIGSIYFELKNFGKSNDYFSKALDISMKLDNDKNIMSVLNNLGMISIEVQNPEKAVAYFEQAIVFGERAGNEIGLADLFHNMGLANYQMGNYIQALDYYKSANEKYQNLGVYSAVTMNNIGQVYIELDYYKQALSYLTEALSFAKKNKQFIVLRDLYQNISVAYLRTGDYQNAYLNFEIFNQYDDSIKNQSYSSKIEELAIRNQLEQQNEKIENTRLALEKSELDIKRRNLLIYVIIIGLVGVSIFAVIILRLLRQKNRAHETLFQQNTEILRSQKIIKKINKALTENEEKLRSIFEISPYAILILDADHMIVDCNETSGKMFMLKNKRELLSNKFESFVKFSDDNPKDILISIQKGEVSKEQFEFVRPDKSTFYAEVSGRNLKDTNDKTATYLLVITDISERLEFISNLKEAKNKAEESDKLKTAFLANMSHEIRTPMNSIIGFSNLLNDTDEDPQRKKEYIAHILQSSNLLVNLIDDIIDISKIEAGQLNFNAKLFNLNDLVREVFLGFSESNTNPDLSYALFLPPGSENVNCKTDPLRLRQILTNLLGNATKFTNSGSIELSYKIIESKPKGMLEFSVKDTGIGIPLDKQEIIFERFRQVDSFQTKGIGGTGLGLAISKKLVELMGGTIWVESELGKGAEFCFTMYYDDDKTSKPMVSKEKNDFTGYNWKGKTILVAEDEDSNYELIKATLQVTNVKLIRAINGAEAFDKVKSTKNIDLILMDIRMPKVNGYDATRLIKAYNADIPVIAITAYAMMEDEEKSILAGCDFYISKPIRPTRLLDTLNGFLADSKDI